MSDDLKARLQWNIKAFGDREGLMKDWDGWRKYIAKGGGGSWPRDAFEALIDEVGVDCADALARIEELERERARFPPIGVKNDFEIMAEFKELSREQLLETAFTLRKSLEVDRRARQADLNEAWNAAIEAAAEISGDEWKHDIITTAILALKRP